VLGIAVVAVVLVAALAVMKAAMMISGPGRSVSNRPERRAPTLGSAHLAVRLGPAASPLTTCITSPSAPFS
jgi:hypothetical protein